MGPMTLFFNQARDTLYGWLGFKLNLKHKKGAESPFCCPNLPNLFFYDIIKIDELTIRKDFGMSKHIKNK